jgi:tetratricopeptide (TPR) repeat protein
MLKRVAQLYVDQGETEAAMPVIEEVLALSPGDTEATVTLADVNLALGQIDAADAILDDAITAHKGRRSPELAMLHQRKARTAAARGDAQKQLEMLQLAFSIDKNNGIIAAELADLAEVLEDWDLAIRVLRTITLIDGDCPITRVQAFLRQAQICYRRGDRQRAVLWARKAKHESPEDPEVAQFLSALGES